MLAHEVGRYAKITEVRWIVDKGWCDQLSGLNILEDLASNLFNIDLDKWLRVLEISLSVLLEVHQYFLLSLNKRAVTVVLNVDSFVELIQIC